MIYNHFHRNTIKILVLLFFAIGIVLIFYLSWKTDPNVAELTYVPTWLSQWADQVNNNRIRTAVPFVFLGLLYGFYILLYKIPTLKPWLFGWAILSGIVLLAEFGQYYLPSRSPDPKDIFWGIVGAASGLGMMFLLKEFVQMLKKIRFWLL